MEKAYSHCWQCKTLWLVCLFADIVDVTYIFSAHKSSNPPQACSTQNRTMAEGQRRADMILEMDDLLDDIDSFVTLGESTALPMMSHVVRRWTASVQRRPLLQCCVCLERTVLIYCVEIWNCSISLQILCDVCDVFQSWHVWVPAWSRLGSRLYLCNT